MRSSVSHLLVAIYVTDVVLGDAYIGMSMFGLGLLWLAYRGVRRAARTRTAVRAWALVRRTWRRHVARPRRTDRGTLGRAHETVEVERISDG